MVLVCSPQHRLASKERVTLEDLHGLEIIGFDPDLEIRQEIDRALTARSVEVRVVMEFDNTETIKRAVEIDAGVSLLPEPTVDREVEGGALVARPLSGIDLKRPIGIIQRRGKELGKTAVKFMQLLLKLPADQLEISALENGDAVVGGHLTAIEDGEAEPFSSDVDLSTGLPAAAMSAAAVGAATAGQKS